MGPHREDRREAPRRMVDELRIWLPLVLSLISTVLALGIVYGKLGGRLDLIEYRLRVIEMKIP